MSSPLTRLAAFRSHALLLTTFAVVPASRAQLVTNEASEVPIQGDAPAVISRAIEVTSASWIEVERDPASSCPDAIELEAATERVLSGTSQSARPRVSVIFDERDGIHRALLRPNEQRASERELTHRGPNCDALVQAIATALAVWIEAQPTIEPPRREEAPKDPEPAFVAPEAPPPDEPADGTFDLGVLGGVALGATRDVAPFVGVDLTSRISHFRAGLGGLWVPPAARPVGPGSIETELILAQIQACGVALPRRSIELDFCVGFAGGAIAARVRGFSDNGGATEPYWALPVTLALGARSVGAAPLSSRWRVGASLLVPTTRQSFSVEGFGVVHDAPPVGAFVFVSIGGGVDL